MGYFLRDVNLGDKTPTPLFRRDRFMQDPIIVDVLSYWETLRAGRIAPMRSEIDPRSITSSLDHTFILEYKDTMDVRFRLAGMKLCEVMGMELRGMPVSALIELSHRDELRRVLDEMVQDPKIVELNLASSADHPGKMTARMLLLPMLDRHGEICRVLGCMTTQGSLVQQPQRFEIKSVKSTRIVGVQKELPPQSRTGFSEDGSVFEGKIERPTLRSDQPKTERLIAGKPYLRLVKDE